MFLHPSTSKGEEWIEQMKAKTKTSARLEYAPYNDNGYVGAILRYCCHQMSFFPLPESYETGFTSQTTLGLINFCFCLYSLVIQSYTMYLPVSMAAKTACKHILFQSPYLFWWANVLSKIIFQYEATIWEEAEWVPLKRAGGDQAHTKRAHLNAVLMLCQISMA